MVLESEMIAAFKPDIVSIHTTWRNLQSFPPANCTEQNLERYVTAEVHRYRAIWMSLANHLDCQVIQKNF